MGAMVTCLALVMGFSIPAAIWECILWARRKMRERRADDFFRKKYNGGWEETSW